MEKDKKKRPWVTYLALAQLAIAVAIMTYGTFSKKLTGRQSDILITASLLIFWILTDIVEPVVMKRFAGITQEQKTAYMKFIALDFAGLAGIAYFLYSMGNAGGNGIVGAMIYVITMDRSLEDDPRSMNSFALRYPRMERSRWSSNYHT